MELDMFTRVDIKNIINEIVKAINDNGYKTYINSDKKLGYGGHSNLNEDYAIKFFVYPYPKLLVIELIKKYESYIIEGKVVKSFDLRDITKDTNMNEFIHNSVNNLIEEIK